MSTLLVMFSLPRRLCLLWVALYLGLSIQVYAGGSGLNTLVVINQSSPASVELGNYFCDQRHVPPANVLRINWTGGNISWTAAQFQTSLLSPILSLLAARQLTNQIDYIVLSDHQWLGGEQHYFRFVLWGQD